jgi:tetratricopeptide (TPR) repeat protein
VRTSAIKLALAVLCASAACAAHAQNADFDSLMKKGDDLDAHCKTSEALAVYLQAEKLQPKDATLLSHIAKQYGESMDDTPVTAEQRARGETALSYAQRAVAADPQSALAQLSLAICYGRLAPLLDNKTKISYSKLVKEHADAALALDPGNDLVWHVLGAWNYELANLNGFVRVIAKVIYGEIPAASNAEAEKDFRKAIAANPARVGNWVELGRTYAAMGRKAEAREALSKGLQLPDHQRDDQHEKLVAREALGSL